MATGTLPTRGIWSPRGPRTGGEVAETREDEEGWTSHSLAVGL